MKRDDRPPTPSQPSVGDDGSERARRVPAPRRPPLPSAARPPLPRRSEEAPRVMIEDLGAEDLETYRPPAPTIPVVTPPAPPSGPLSDVDRTSEVLAVPASAPAPSGPLSAVDRTSEIPVVTTSSVPPPDTAQPALGPPQQPYTISDVHPKAWTGLPSSQTGSQVHRQPGLMPAPSSSVSSSMSAVSSSYRTPSRQRDTSADDGWPLGYVVVSAVFLAIAVVGFGLWLAFEVISL